MKRIYITVMLLAAITITGLSQQSGSHKIDVEAERRALAQNEREFARMAAAKGIRTAFLAYVADDCILFRPTPTNGKAWWMKEPEDPALLSWEPIYVDVSSGGDLGYSLGPWEYRPKGPNDKPVAFGHYLSIWRRQSDGSWKFVIDQGTTNPAPSSPTPALSFPTDTIKNSGEDKPDVKISLLQKELFEQERVFSQSSAKDTPAAFLNYSAADIRFMRPGHIPAVGRDEMLRVLATTPGTLSWEPTFAAIARSGELGYTYGDYVFDPAPLAGKTDARVTGNYVRIWKKKEGDKWQVVVDVLAPHKKK